MFKVASIGEHDARDPEKSIEAVKEDVVRAIKTIVTLVHTLDAAPTEVCMPEVCFRLGSENWSGHVYFKILMFFSRRLQFS